MAVNAVPGNGYLPAPTAPSGVAAQLGEARRMLRAAVPADSWDAVLSEVERLQTDRGIPLLAALHAVHAKTADGWLPWSSSGG